MNFLAHLFLSGKNEEVMIGNLMEDYIVGRIDHERNNHLNKDIKHGIMLHRLIDTATDSNPFVSNCKLVLYEKYHKYSAVLIDIYFDHFLAVHWDFYSKEPFDLFRKRVYFSFEKHWNILPEKMKPMIESMITHDWLKNYAEFWGIERALLGVSRRTKFESNMEKATDDLKIHYKLFKDNFEKFFPELLETCNNFLDVNGYENIG
ncbi:Acyl carrier protein phosphodiesterase [Emticicia oligotrophica DSM 17448]|uniref:Acyl carrier protein phosphodiesterase n=1 Tax=Emticicia oligotrophica (strain DSM 17448 / CIP 109782 / MTCC 6937 / GPTSA100-15) TaxID=929562 RepID=A0ABN4ATW2_EMTOG|nr:acyl carrier protein phosphodiesterase [Emticicia oligotrophica]AFK05301.1 Acyl carrier protein phosphodiesterase [Emticicia oligotrophica DSM 17448]